MDLLKAKKWNRIGKSLHMSKDRAAKK